MGAKVIKTPPRRDPATDRGFQQRRRLSYDQSCAVGEHTSLLSHVSSLLTKLPDDARDIYIELK
jgi:hypothetical protein